MVGEDAAYDACRLGWNLTVDSRPDLIVNAKDAHDVQAAIEYANANDLPIGVVTTGHGMPRNVDHGVLIRTGELNHVSVDPEAKTARIGGGAQWQDVLAATAPYGLAGPCGSAPHVGVIGYLLGGGFGLMIRKHGLGIDHLRSFEIVTASGDILRASPEENTDLFWAVRGGGGAFGVVTEVELSLVEQPTIFGGTILYPAERREELLIKWLDWIKTVPEEVSSSFDLMAFPPLPMIPEPLQGKAFVMIETCVCGSCEEAEAWLAPVRSWGDPVMDAYETMPFIACGSIYRDPVDPLPAAGNGALLGALDEASALAMLRAFGEPFQVPNLKLQLRHIGGAAGRRSLEDGAIGNRRQAEFALYVLGVVHPFATAEALFDHATQVIEALGDRKICRGPLTWLGEAAVRADLIRGAFDDAAWARLVDIKQTRDPRNAFRFASVGIVLAETSA